VQCVTLGDDLLAEIDLRQEIRIAPSRAASLHGMSDDKPKRRIGGAPPGPWTAPHRVGAIVGAFVGAFVGAGHGPIDVTLTQTILFAIIFAISGAMLGAIVGLVVGVIAGYRE